MQLLAQVGPEEQCFDPPGELYEKSMEEARQARGFGFLEPGHRVIDVGCGVGRHAIPLTALPVEYHGLEPNRGRVEIARRFFEPWKHIRFEHVDVANAAYNPQGTIDPLAWTIPFDADTSDLVVMASVLSHVESLAVLRHYVDEAWRILRPGGGFCFSVFRSPPQALGVGLDRSVFRETDILDAIRRFRVLETRAGLTADEHDQWVLVLRKPGGQRV